MKALPVSAPNEDIAVRKLISVAFAAALAFAGSPAWAEDYEGDVPPGRSFICDEGTPFVQVILNDDGATLMLESEQLPMAEMPAASGFAYDITLPLGHYVVKGKGDEVTLFVDDQAPKTCFEDDAYNVDYISLFGNYSLGGKVRTGPGMDYEQVGSLAYGTEITILSRTDVSMDGYDWFQIEWGDGNRAFQWGGIMCSNALHIIGIYDPCPAEFE